MKDIMISKLLETIENLSCNKNYHNCNITTTSNSCKNDSKIPRSKNTHLAPPPWDILSTTSDTTTNSYNGSLINVIPGISIKEQLREARLQKDDLFKEYQRLHSENKKLEEKPNTFPPNTCVLMSESILNGVIERNLSNDRSVKVRKFPGATDDDLRHHALFIIRYHYLSIHFLSAKIFTYSRSLLIHAVKFTSRDILYFK